MRRTTFLICLVVGLLAGAAVASASRVTRVQRIVDGILPGAVTHVVRTRLEITLPASDVPAHETTALQRYTSYELGWRAAMASRLIDNIKPISKYTVTVAGGARLAGWADANHGGYASSGVFATSIDHKLGTVSSSAALKQVASNLAVLKRALPASADLHDHITLIPSGIEAGRYGIQVDLSFAYKPSLKRYLGDVLVGLETGLYSGGASPLMGMAIVARSANGAPLVAEWGSVEPTTGTVDLGRRFIHEDEFSVTTKFPDLTGGPAGTSMSIGESATVS